MSHLRPYVGIEEDFDDIVPTPRTHTIRPSVPEPAHVNLSAILSEPPTIRIDAHDEGLNEVMPSLPPPPRLPRLSPPLVVAIQDDWTVERTPAPMTSDLGSIYPVALSRPPSSGASSVASTSVHRGWKIATAGLAVALALGVVAMLAPVDALRGNATQSFAAAPMEAPPHFSISDLPVVGVVPEAKPFLINEVAIFADRVNESDLRDEPPIQEERIREDGEEVSRDTEQGALEEDSLEVTPQAPALAGFDRGLAASALGAAAASALSCRQAGSPAGIARVSVTFAPSGRTTTALVTGTFAGTAVGGCIARTFRAARVEPYDGNLVTVHKTVAIR